MAMAVMLDATGAMTASTAIQYTGACNMRYWCVRACVRACMRARVHTLVRMHVRERVRERERERERLCKNMGKGQRTSKLRPCSGHDSSLSVSFSVASVSFLPSFAISKRRPVTVAGSLVRMRAPRVSACA